MLGCIRIATLATVLGAAGPLWAGELDQSNLRDPAPTFSAGGLSAWDHGNGLPDGPGFVGLENDNWPDLGLRLGLEDAGSSPLERAPGGPAAGTGGQYNSGGANLGVLMDTMVEWRNTTSLTPYVGGTLGWSKPPTSATLGQLGSEESAQSSSLNPPSLDTLAWGGVLGVDWAFTQRLSTSLSYRYLNRADSGSSADNATSDTDDVSHDIFLFLNYRF